MLNGKLHRCLNYARAPFRSLVVILLYHRVVELEADVQQLSVTPDKFTEHMDFISNHYDVMSLGELVDRTTSKKLPKRGVVVTFDDGYADNLNFARPILERYSIPATFFISTECLASNREFWWDALEQILLNPGELPECLSLKVVETVFDFVLGPDRYYSAEKAKLFSNWSVVDKHDPTRRHELYRILCEKIRNLQTVHREDVMCQLSNWAGCEVVVRGSHRRLSRAEISDLNKNGLFEIGAHTVTHAMLSAYSKQLQYDEIINSKVSLDKILGLPVNYFSYPYGSLSDYDAQSVGIVKNANFLGACSNYCGVVNHSTDIYQLPRLVVRNWDCKEFAGKLEKCFYS